MQCRIVKEVKILSDPKQNGENRRGTKKQKLYNKRLRTKATNENVTLSTLLQLLRNN